MNSAIINNILNDDILRASCISQVDDYMASQGNSMNKTELIRFSRHISLETYFQKNNQPNPEIHSKSNSTTNLESTIESNSKSNIETILEELSTIAKVDTSQNSDTLQKVDTVLLLQLSSLLDSFLKELSSTEQKIYLYRYFFAYEEEDIAKLCNTQASNVHKTINACNNKLSNLINNNKLNCNTKTLLLSFTDIDDSYLVAISKKETKKADNREDFSKRKLVSSWPILLNFLFAITILVLVVLNIAQFTKNNPSDEPESEETTTEDILDPNAFNPESAYTYIDGVKTINIEEILKHQSMVEGFEQPFVYYYDRFSGNYMPIHLVDDIPISDYIGEEIPELADEFKTYYKLLGNNGLQYIIRKFDDTYTLYYLNSVSVYNGAGMGEPDSDVKYHDILSGFYGITDSTKIQEIYVMADSSYSDYADVWTKKLIDSQYDLAEVYKQLRTSVCSGKIIDSYIVENSLSRDYLFANSVDVYIQPKNGTVIEGLLYYPDGNFFFDRNSEFIYKPVEKENNTYLVEMLSFDLHKEDPMDPELWKIYLHCVESNPNFLSISIDNDPSQSLYGLYIGSEYTIDKLENDTWVTVPPVAFSISYPLIPFDRKLSSGSIRSLVYYQHYEKYGKLEAGTYRLTITIYDSNSKDLSNPNHRDFSVEFLVNDGENVFVYENEYPATETR